MSHARTTFTHARTHARTHHAHAHTTSTHTQARTAHLILARTHTHTTHARARTHTHTAPDQSPEEQATLQHHVTVPACGVWATRPCSAWRQMITTWKGPSGVGRKAGRKRGDCSHCRGCGCFLCQTSTWESTTHIVVSLLCWPPSRCWTVCKCVKLVRACAS